MAAAADLLTAFDIGLIEATGIDVTATRKDEKDPAKPASSSSARISRLAYTGSAGGQPTDIRMEGLDAGDQENRVKIGSLSLTGFSILPTLEGLKNLEGKSFKDFDTATLRSLAPTIGTLRISGVDLQSTSKEDETSKPVPISLSLKDFELTADKPINALPSNIRLGLKNLAMPLPADSDDEGLKELMALGYKAIDLSFLMAADWNESASEITLKEMSLQSQDMANIALTGLIGNVSKDIFSTDQATAASALLGAKAKAANVVVEDRGLLERHLAQTAKEQKTKPESLRQLYASAAPMVISSFLGNSEQAISLGQAISRFIKGPGKLTIDAQPKNPSGFGFLEAMLTSDPKQVLEKLNVTAKVE